MNRFSRLDLSTFLDQPLVSPFCRRSQKPCEAASKGDQVGEDITVQCTGAVKAGDLLLKKTGDYLLELPPALHCFSLRFVCCTFFCMLYARKYFVMDVSSYHDVHLPLFPIEAV